MGAEAEASGSPYLPLWFSRHWGFRTHTPFPPWELQEDRGCPGSLVEVRMGSFGSPSVVYQGLWESASPGPGAGV